MHHSNITYPNWTKSLLSAIFVCLQWGSEHRTSLMFRSHWLVQSSNGLLAKWHLNTILNQIQYSDHKFKYQTKISLNSDVSIIWMFSIQIPTVLQTNTFRDSFKGWGASDIQKWTKYQNTRFIQILDFFNVRYSNGKDWTT